MKDHASQGGRRSMDVRGGGRRVSDVSHVGWTLPSVSHTHSPRPCFFAKRQPGLPETMLLALSSPPSLDEPVSPASWYVRPVK